MGLLCLRVLNTNFDTINFSLSSRRTAKAASPRVYYFGVLPTEMYNLVGLRQVRIAILTNCNPTFLPKSRVLPVKTPKFIIIHEKKRPNRYRNDSDASLLFCFGVHRALLLEFLRLHLKRSPMSRFTPQNRPPFRESGLLFSVTFSSF